MRESFYCRFPRWYSGNTTKGLFAVGQKRRFQLVSLDRLPKLIEAFLGVNSEAGVLFPESALC